MTAWVSLYAPVIAKVASGSDIPLAMLLGHVQHESGGRPNDRTKLDERGLFQIHPGTSKEMGFDHARMFDPNYNIWAGVEMFKRMADKLQREYRQLFPSRNDFFWHVVRFEFSIGSGAVRQILRTMAAEHFQPRSWAQFESYLTANRQRLLSLTKHDPVKWAGMVDRVFATGEKLVKGGVVVGGGAFAILCLAGLLLYMFSVGKRESTKGRLSMATTYL
jgi:membrane-bound lytic murein transglycosylase MltF